MEGEGITLEGHTPLELAPWFVVNIDTLIYTWIVVGFLLLITFLATRRITSGPPTGVQNVVELVMEFVGTMVRENIGSRSRFIPPLAITMFIFLLVANWMGLIPLFKSPTADINTTVALALMVFVLIHFYSIRAKRMVPYVGHYFKPFAALAPINIIDEVAKPVTLSFRLFGNIFAGEVVIFLIFGLMPLWISFIPGIVWLGWSMLIGVIQAFVFTILTVVYLAFALEPVEDH